MKEASREQAEKEQEALKEAADEDAQGKEARKLEKGNDKMAQKIMMAELKDIEKERQSRDKERQQKWREAAGLAKPRAVKRLMDYAPEAVAADEGTAAKAAKVAEDVD